VKAGQFRGHASGFALILGVCLAQISPAPGATEWNQWLGGPGRTLSAEGRGTGDQPPTVSERWRRPLGSGFAGLSIWSTNAITAMTDGKQDHALLLNPETGGERWRVPLGRTKKRAEGTPPGPLSTPAIDAEAAYVQALDGRFLCLEIGSGKLRWELDVKRSLKAYEPGYGFASSPLLLGDLVVLVPAGSTKASVTALDRRTGEVRWQAALGAATEYSSATFAKPGEAPQIVAALGSKVVGLAALDGRVLWEVGDVTGGLWTPSILANGHVFLPLAQETQVREFTGRGSRLVWSSAVFEGVMGPVVEIQGLLVGHHQRRLTAVDAATGEQVWRLPNETDGQIVAYGRWLVFVNDRKGQIELLAVDRQGAKVLRSQAVIKPTRMETPLTVAGDTVFLRSPEELVALRLGP